MQRLLEPWQRTVRCASLEKKPEAGTRNLKSFSHDKWCLSGHLYKNFCYCLPQPVPIYHGRGWRDESEVRSTHCKSIHLSYNYLSYPSIVLRGLPLNSMPMKKSFKWIPRSPPLLWLSCYVLQQQLRPPALSSSSSRHFLLIKWTGKQ